MRAILYLGMACLLCAVPATSQNFEAFGLPPLDFLPAVDAEAGADIIIPEAAEEEEDKLTPEDRAELEAEITARREQALKILAGYGDVKWGLSVAEISAVVPGMREVDPMEMQREWLPRVSHYLAPGFGLVIKRHFWFVDDQLWKFEHYLEKKVIREVGRDYTLKVFNRKYHDDEETALALEEATVRVSLQTAGEKSIVIYERVEIYDETERAAMDKFREIPEQKAKALELERLL